MTTASHASRMRVPPNCSYVFRALSRSRSGLRPLISEGSVSGRATSSCQSEAPSPTPSQCACPSADPVSKRPPKRLASSPRQAAGFTSANCHSLPSQASNPHPRHPNPLCTLAAAWLPLRSASTLVSSGFPPSLSPEPCPACSLRHDSSRLFMPLPMAGALA